MKPPRQLFSAFLAASFLVLILTGAAQPASAQDRVYRIDTIALSGEALPGTGGLGLDFVGDLNLSDAGDVIVTGTWTSADFSVFGSGLWHWRAGTMTPIALYGDPIPGLAGTVFGAALDDSARVNSQGNVAFVAEMVTAVDFPLGLFAGAPGTTSLIAGVGDPAPGAGGLVFSILDVGGPLQGPGSGATINELLGPALNNQGDFAFRAQVADCVDCLEPNVVQEGLWLNSANGLELLALTGDPAPGTGDSFTTFPSYAFNDAGQLAFQARFDPAATGGKEGIWLGTPPGAFSVVAKSGDAAPGTGHSFSQFTFNSLVGPAMNASGDLVFPARLNNGDWASDFGIWALTGGLVELVAREGDPAPGTIGALFRDFDQLQINVGAEVAFRGSLSDNPLNQDEGIWVGAAGSPGLVVRTGDEAPGLAGQSFFDFDRLALNASGELAFNARPDSFSGFPGIWVGTVNGLSAVAHRDLTLEVRPGDLRTIEYAVSRGNINNDGGVITSLNDAGQIMFTAFFDDGTRGTFLATPLDPAINQPPLADAGADQTVFNSDSITLDAAGSSDPERTPLIFTWQSGGSVLGQGPRISVGPLAIGSHVVTLTVTDQHGAGSSDTATVTVANRPPVADAGPDQALSGYRQVALDGTGSIDPDGEALSFVWTLGGARIATGPQPTVEPLPVGVHTVVLSVSDPQGASASDSVLVTVANQFPVAQAGPDRMVDIATVVTLDGSGSQDPDGDTLTHVWSLAGVQIATGQRAAVGPFAAGSYEIVLTVTDPLGASASDRFTLIVVNQPPAANAGPDQTVRTLETVALDGTGSSDPEGGVLSYVWSLGGRQIATGPTPAVGPFDDGVLTITLTVTDPGGASATDTVSLTVLNRPPLANAGPDQTVQGPAMAMLDGTGSADPEGKALGYSWSLGGVEIATGPQPSVGPFDDGSHVITLTVTDPAGATASDSMTLTVLNAPPAADAGPDQTIASKRKAVDVTLDGSASVDADGTIISYVWTRDGTVVGQGVTTTLRLNRGSHTVLLTVTDDDGATASDQVVVTIVKGTQVSSN